MDEQEEKRVRLGEIDWVRKLQDSLLCQVLLNLSTKDVVKSSVLSTRWRNLWKFVPALDLAYSDFPDFLSFVDRFLDFNSESHFKSCKLKYDCDGDYDPEHSLLNRWINTVVRRKVKHVDVLDVTMYSYEIHIPPTIYTCKSLVSVNLCELTLPGPKFVSLPCLKLLNLTKVHFADDLGLETQILLCPILKSLIIERSFCDDIQVLHVRSQSLLNFTHCADGSEDLEEDLVVTVDAPRLKYLRLSDCRIANFILNHPVSLVKADIDTEFNLCFGKKFDPNDLPKKNMIRNFLVGISHIKDMIISSTTLEVIYDYSRCEPLPLFRNLSVLRVKFYGYRWEMLPIFLESCLNLKSLVVGITKYLEEEGINILSVPRCFLSSLEYVEIEMPLKGNAKEIKLVSYLVENSTILKKITLSLDGF